MSDERKMEVAKQYVDTQLETMKRHGSAPELSKQEYQGLIQQVAATVTSEKSKR